MNLGFPKKTKLEYLHGLSSKFLIMKILKIILPFIVVGLAIFIGIKLMKTSPQAKRRRPAKVKTLVEAINLTSCNHQIILNTMGTVIPAREVELYPRITGELIEVSPKMIPGGRFIKGEKLVKVDPADYELELIKRENELKTAELNYEVKYAEYKFGLYEWNKVTGSNTNDNQRRLMSKLPQLESAKAAVEMAQATLEKAKLNLQRTVIKAPFNSIIMEENVEVGAQVQLSKKLALLAGTDEYWVELSLPIDRLQWIGSTLGKFKNVPATVNYPNGEFGTTVWHGLVSHLKGELEPKGRMVRLVVMVKDPLGKNIGNHSGPILIAGSHVRIAIHGRKLKNVYVIPRSALHDNNMVWIASVDDRLKLRQVEVKWKERNEVVISSGIKTGEKLIISELAAPVEGMLLTVELGYTKK